MNMSRHTIITNPTKFAHKVRLILSGGTLYFAVEWDVDKQGNIDDSSLDESYTCWYGVKTVECFDAACLLVGQVGGEKWMAFNITTPMPDEAIKEICKQIFYELEVEAVCVFNEN